MANVQICFFVCRLVQAQLGLSNKYAPGEKLDNIENTLFLLGYVRFLGKKCRSAPRALPAEYNAHPRRLASDLSNNLDAAQSFSDFGDISERPYRFGHPRYFPALLI